MANFGAGLAKGLMVTLQHVFRRPVTTQYPEQRLTPSRRTRGNELVWDVTKCTGCSTCAKTCPQGAIVVKTAVDLATNRYHVDKIEVDTGYCICCGLCVESCPYSALRMGYSYERAKYKRDDLVQVNEMMNESPERPASAFMHPETEEKLPEQTLLVEGKQTK